MATPATPLIERLADADRKQQAYMRRCVAELQKVHSLSERDAASIMITVTSVVGLGPKSAR